MKKAISLIIFIAICLLLIFSKQISQITTDVIVNFYIKVLPLLAPTILLNYIFIYSGGISNIIYDVKLKDATKHKINKYSLIVLGLISGTPSLASMINEELDKSLTKKEVQNILNCFTVPSLPFLIALINSCSFNNISKILVIAIPFSIQFILFFINDQKIKSDHISFNAPKNENIISKAILSTARTIVLMSGSIILFSLVSYPFELFLKGNVLMLIKGLMEFSYPLSYLFSTYSIENLSFIIAIISFSSVSLLVQVKLIAPKVSFKEILKKRLIITALSLLLTTFVIFFLNIR
ncbi:MAG: hypothetical protein J1F32_00940 [Erysipelotrichales bacterium]|nr:hypothetical protein [Erysipelotrichales bacterium]